MTGNKAKLLLGIILLLGTAGLLLGEEVKGQLINPGFEQQLNGWSTSNPEVSIIPEAAYQGKAGMRIHVTDNLPTGTSIYSSRLPVTPGQSITLGFWARSSDKTFCGIYVYMLDSNGKRLKFGKGGKGVMLAPNQSDGNWHEYTREFTAPEDAQSVVLWIHSWGGTKGTLDLDDITLAGISPDAVAVPPAPAAAPEKKIAVPDLSELPERTSPPVIILKLDDLRPISGKVHPLWIKLDKYLANRSIKYGAGVICKDLPEATPEFCQWVKERHESGRVEFWFHGWDHQTYKADDGKSYSEFAGRGYEEQAGRFARSQQAAADKFGFHFRTFGPPGGGARHFDEDTCKAMANDQHMQAWLYSQPLDNKGEELVKAGKITILDRVWAVNLEAAVGVPSYDRLLAGYAKYPDRPYFVLQGHPMAWSGERFKEFERIIEFLEGQNAVFVTPGEYAAQLKKEDAPAQE